MKKLICVMTLALWLIAIESFAATVTQTVTFQLTWNDNQPDGVNAEQGFEIMRCAGVGCTNFVRVGGVGSNVTTATDSISGDTGNLTYRYRVDAYNSAGRSSSGVVDAVSPGIVVIPGSPSGLIAVVVGVTVP